MVGTSVVPPAIPSSQVVRLGKFLAFFAVVIAKEAMFVGGLSATFAAEPVQE